MRRRALTGAIAALVAAPLAAQQPAVDSAVATFLRGATTPEVEFLAAARPIGDGRFAVVAARSRRLEGAPVSVMACVAADSGGAWRPTCVALPTLRMDANLFAPQLESAGFLAGDLDNDGALELLVGLNYGTRPEPAVGSDTYIKYYAIELVPRPRVAVIVAAGEQPGASSIPRTVGRVRVEDTNGDGHGDLVLEGRACRDRDALENDDCRPVRRVWTWRAARGWGQP